MLTKDVGGRLADETDPLWHIVMRLILKEVCKRIPSIVLDDRKLVKFGVTQQALREEANWQPPSAVQVPRPSRTLEAWLESDDKERRRHDIASATSPIHESIKGVYKVIQM